MYCSKCGTHLPDDASFCKECGNPLISIDRNEGRLSLKKRRVILLACISISIVFIGLIIFIAQSYEKIGNTQTTNANACRFLCQRNNEQPYFCVPGYSNEVLSYNNGRPKVAYYSFSTIYSIFDADDLLILETRESVNSSAFTSINKETGKEEVLLAFYEAQGAYILNIYGGKIYYNLSSNAEMHTTESYATFAYDIETGENQYLLNGGCFVTPQGIYYSAKGSANGELWFVKYKDIAKSEGKFINGSYDDSTIFFNPLFLENGYLYYYWTSTGWPEGNGMPFYRKGQALDYIGDGNNLNIINGKLFYIQEGSLYSMNPHDLSQKNLVVSNTVPDESGIDFYDLAVFEDPQDSSKTVIATMGALFPEVYFWNEEGELITKHEAN